MRVFRAGTAMVNTILLLGALAQHGCINPGAAKEPYPHPYVKHKDLPFTTDPNPVSVPTMTDSLRLAVCDLQSQTVCPVGAYFVNGQLTRLLEPIAYEGNLADAIGRQLAAYGVRTARLRGETGNVLLLASDTRNATDLLLKGTILGMEFSQHGDKKNPYDFFYIMVRFCLLRTPDGQLVWQGNVAAWLKLPPDPESSLTSLAGRAAKALGGRLMESAPFRHRLEAGNMRS